MHGQLVGSRHAGIAYYGAFYSGPSGGETKGAPLARCERVSGPIIVKFRRVGAAPSVRARRSIAASYRTKRAPVPRLVPARWQCEAPIKL